MDTALIVGILSPALTFAAVLVANYFTSRQDARRWQREQAFEKEKWLRAREDERQKLVQTRLYDIYTSCLQALSTLSSIEIVPEISSIQKYINEFNKKRKEAETHLFTLLLHTFHQDSPTEAEVDFRDILFEFLALDQPLALDEKNLPREIEKATAINKKANDLRISIVGLARIDSRLGTTLK